LQLPCARIMNIERWNAESTCAGSAAEDKS
jgi:hypothetical protein